LISDLPSVADLMADIIKEAQQSANRISVTISSEEDSN